MSATKLGLYALLLDLAAASLLLFGAEGNAPFLLYLSSHAGASALFALGVWLLTPARWRTPKLPMLALFFVLCFAVPGLGLVILIGGAVVLPLLREVSKSTQFQAVLLPALDRHQRMVKTIRQSGIRNFIGNGEAPVASRLKALVALQAVPTRVSSPVLRELLSDGVEDLRLLAYGMLDREEKRLNQAIHETLTHLAACTSAAARHEAQRKLAGLYWELVYQNLAQGDLRTHALQEALRHVEAALLGDGGDAGLYLLHGRVLHALGRHDTAHQAYSHALDAGIPAPRVLPYLAELAFEVQDYGLVRRIMERMQGWQGQSGLTQVISYWTHMQ